MDGGIPLSNIRPVAQLFQTTPPMRIALVLLPRRAPAHRNDGFAAPRLMEAVLPPLDMYVHIYIYIYIHICIYIYEDETLISWDQQAGGKIKKIGPGGHEGPAHEGPAHEGPAHEGPAHKGPGGP